MPRSFSGFIKVVVFCAWVMSLGPVQALADDVLPIQKAIATTSITARGLPIAGGYRQPMVNLSLANQTEAAQVLRVPAGTTLIPVLDGFSRLVTVGSDEVRVEPGQEINVELTAYSLDYHTDFPSKLKKVEYTIGDIDVTVLDVLEKIGKYRAQTTWAAQFAIWSVSTGKSLEELAAEATRYPIAEHLDQTRLILGMQSAIPTDTLAPTNSPLPPTATTIVAAQTTQLAKPLVTTVAQDTQVKKGISLGGILVGLIVVMALAFGVAILLSAREKPVRSQPTGSDEAPLVFPSPFSKPGEVKIPEQPTEERLETRPTSPAAKMPSSEMVVPPATQEGSSAPQPRNIRLKGLAGPHQDKLLHLVLPCVVSRGNLAWLTIDEASVSTPHAIFDFSGLPYRVKDMNSKNGVWVDDTKQGRGFVEVQEGQKIRLGRCVFVITPSGMTLVEGPTAPKAYQAGDELLMVARQEARVVITGDQDKRISDAHVFIYEKDEAVFARDLNSKNGTIVNKVTIQTDTVLKPGDHLVLGASEFEVQWDEN